MILYNRHEAEVLLEWLTAKDKKEKLFKYMLDVRSIFIYNKMNHPKNCFTSEASLFLYTLDKTKEWLYATHPKLPEVIKRFLLGMPMFAHIKKNQIGFQWNRFMNDMCFYYSEAYCNKRHKSAVEHDSTCTLILKGKAGKFIPKEFIKRQH